MPTGVSNLYYPDQPEPLHPLEIDKSYYLIRLWNAQAFFPAGLFTQPQFLVLSSEVESSFWPDTTVQSLHQVTLLKKNIPCSLGVGTNLTDWLPARATDSLRISVKYTVTQHNPFKTLLDKVGELNLDAPVSLVRPDWAAAIKVTQIVTSILGHFLQEGGETEIFRFTVDLNLAHLQAGYHAFIGSTTDEPWPNKLEISSHGHLAERGGHALSRFSYAVLQVLSLPRRGFEKLREETWGDLLQMDKDQALAAASSGNDEKRREALQTWRTNLAQVRLLAQRDRSYLQREIDEILASAQLEVEQKLLPQTTQEATGLDVYPDEWEQVLGVRTPQELRRMVRDYQDALEVSKRLITQYNL